MHIVALLPFAFVMIAGPPIITAVFFATSERWRSAARAAGGAGLPRYPFTHVLPFIALTLLLVAFPSLLVLASGRRAKDLLPKIRDWMNTHSWSSQRS